MRKTIGSLAPFGLAAAVAGCAGCMLDAGRAPHDTRYERSADMTAGTVAAPYKGVAAKRWVEDRDDEESLDTPRKNAEAYKDYGVRPWVDSGRDNLSTFSIDVDTGAYTVARRKLRGGQLPPAASVRVEEFVNFFRQDYPSPTKGQFSVLSEAAASPFRAGKVILRVGLQGKRIAKSERKRANLVFLIDTSGSMSSHDKLRLVKKSLRILVENLRKDDRVSICTYAGNVSKVLDPTPASQKRKILGALNRLRAGGSTAMGSGIDLAYALAAKQAGAGVNTRVIVFSDGDANVGPKTHHQILEQIAGYRRKGITLGTVGFGMGNYKDTMMEQLANKGDGIYAYVDTIEEANRLFSEDLTQNIEMIARDVKLQVVFDKTRVKRYRLLGYENRAILDRDFRNDKVDAGEVGAGHTVTALYELELVEGARGPLGQVSLRYKDADRLKKEGPDLATEETFSLSGYVHPQFKQASQRFRFTVCVAEFAEVLRKSPHTHTRLADLLPLAEGSLAKKHDDREHGLVDLIRRAAFLVKRNGT